MTMIEEETRIPWTPEDLRVCREAGFDPLYEVKEEAKRLRRLAAKFGDIALDPEALESRDINRWPKLLRARFYQTMVNHLEGRDYFDNGDGT
jgi:hypothetical protein